MRCFPCSIQSSNFRLEAHSPLTIFSHIPDSSNLSCSCDFSLPWFTTELLFCNMTAILISTKIPVVTVSCGKKKIIHLFFSPCQSVALQPIFTHRLIDKENAMRRTVIHRGHVMVLSLCWRCEMGDLMTRKMWWARFLLLPP